MNNQSPNEILKNCVKAALGLALFACGVYLIIQANIGVAPWDVFCLGLAKQTGFLYGTCSIIISVVILFLDAVIMTEKIGLGMIIDTLVVGKTVDLLNFLDLVHDPGNLWISLIMITVGFFIMGYGQYIYISVGLGCGPRDAFQVGLGKKMPRLPIGVVLIIILLVVLIIGYLLGGPVGIGTLIAPFGVGLMQQLVFNMRHFEPKNVVHQDLIESIRIIFRKRKA